MRAAFLLGALALLAYVTTISGQALDFQQNAVYVTLTLRSNLTKCPLTNDSTVTALQSQIAEAYRLHPSEVNITTNCNTKTAGVLAKGPAAITIMNLFVSDVNSQEFVNPIVASAVLVQPTTQPPKDRNIKNWKIAIGVTVCFLAFFFVILLVIVLMNCKVLRQN